MKALRSALALSLLAACHAAPPATETPPQAISLLGRELRSPALPEERRAELEALLDDARARLDEHPDSEEAWIWVGRRQAYLGDYRGAIATYTRALERFPASSELLRHRGHRWLTVRELARAVDDLALAAARLRPGEDELEPDGQPNALGVPRSTKQGNVHYHLALAHYVRGNFAAALAGWERCRELAGNDDMRVAVDNWRYLTLRRLGLDDRARELAASVRPDMDVIENTDYHRLLLFYAGRIGEHELLANAAPEGVGYATTWYGYGAWQLVDGRRERALAVFEAVVGDAVWPAFGHLAAEAELARAGWPGPSAGPLPE